MEPLTKFPVLRIPADGSASELVELNVYLDNMSCGSELRNPSLRFIIDEEYFQTQLKTTHHELYQDLNFCMYKCTSESKTERLLPMNRTFAHVKYMHVYGDAFIFELPKTERSDKDGTQFYVAPDLKEFARSFEEKGEVYRKAEWLSKWNKLESP